MSREKVSRARYLELLNEQLRQHPDYEDDMEFEENPDGDPGGPLMGFRLTGVKAAPGIMKDVIQAINRKYESEPEKK